MAETEYGVALAKFYLHEASRLLSAAVISYEIDYAEKLRKSLLQSWAKTEIFVRDEVQFGSNVLRETRRARAALDILEKYGGLYRSW